MKIRMCFRIKGLAVDENGSPAPAGLCIDLGETDKEIDYAALAKKVDKAAVLKMACLDGSASPEDVEVITPEEYDKEFGDSDA